MNKEWCIVFARGTFFRKCCKCLFRHFHYTTSRIKVSFFYAKSRTCSFIDKTILFQKRFLLKIRLPFLVIITMHWYLVKFLPKTDDFRNQLVGTLLCSMLSIFHWNLSSLVIQCATMLIKSYIILGDIYTTKENFIYVSGFCWFSGKSACCYRERNDMDIVFFRSNSRQICRWINKNLKHK